MNELSEQSKIIAGPRFHIVWFLFHHFPYEEEHSCCVYNITNLGQAARLMMSGI